MITVYETQIISVYFRNYVLARILLNRIRFDDSILNYKQCFTKIIYYEKCQIRTPIQKLCLCSVDCMSKTLYFTRRGKCFIEKFSIKIKAKIFGEQTCLVWIANYVVNRFFLKWFIRDRLWRIEVDSKCIQVKYTIFTIFDLN